VKFLFQLRNDRRIGQGRSVAHRSSIGDVAQEPAHDFAATRLRQFGGEENLVGTRDRTDLLRHMALQLIHQGRRAIDPCLKQHEGADRLPLDLVLFADDCCPASSI